MNNMIKIIIVVMAIGLMGCGNMSGTGYISPDNITDDGSVNLPQNNNIVDDGTTDDGIVDDGPTYDPNYPSVENPDKTGLVPTMDDGTPNGVFSAPAKTMKTTARASEGTGT